MAPPDDNDDSISYKYDNDPLGNWYTRPYDTPPQTGVGRSAWSRWPRRRRGRPRRPRGSKRFTWRRPHPARWVGDALIFLTGADKKLIGSVGERIRYHTIAVLMLLTAGQAWYSASLFMAVSLGKPLRDEIWFGVFFAAAVLFIDRSIISGASKFKVDKVTGELAAPKKFTPVLIVRIGIAVAAALLMSEMILLQVFAGDINEKVQSNQRAATTAADNQIVANYQSQIAKLQAQINGAQQTVKQDQATVKSDYAAMNCQEFGCPAQHIVGGFGPGYAAAKANWQNALQQLADDQQHVKDVVKAVQPKIDQDNVDEQNAITGAQPAISNADKVLSQEEAFWQLTVSNGSVAATRLLLSLLILGIDMAPILTKLTGRASDHDTAAHQAAYEALNKIKQDARTTLHKQATRAGADRQLHDLALGTELHAAQQGTEVARAEAGADAEVRLYEIKLDVSLRKHWAHQAFIIAKSAPPPRSPANQPGWPNGHQNGRQNGRQNGSPNPNGYRNGDPNSGGAHGAGEVDTEPLVGTMRSPQPAPPPPMAPDTRRDAYADWTLPEPAPAPEPEPAYLSAPPVEVPDPDLVDEEEPDDPGLGWGSDQIDDFASILSAAARDEPAEALVLDHRWALLHRLPGADPGGGGTVWEARDLNDPARAAVVVKTVSSDQVDRQTTTSIQQLNLRHEQRAAGAAAAAGLGSEHIGEIIAQGMDRGFYYLVYPLYRPGSLARYCDHLGPRQTLRWSAQVIFEVLSGLTAASAEGLVHLDIKPGNIVLDGPRARVIDWGLSRVWTASPQSTWRPQGSPFYACPEVVLFPSVAPNSPLVDLYGVGATFYRLLTGEAPLERKSPRNRDYQAYRELLEDGEPPLSVHELVTGMPRPVSTLIDRWLSFDPAKRAPAGTSPQDVTRVARDELAALLPTLPEMTVGKVTARRWRR